jgi:serine/threonine protein phosphatase PrpC
MEFESAIRSHVGCKRKMNEDAVLGRPDLGLWAVADGMGGHEAGEVASGMVVEGLAALTPGLPLEPLTASARVALAAVSARLAAMGAEGPQRRTIGSTVVALIAGPDAFACLWAGDSRAYRARDGAIAQLTRDHSLVQELVDAGELDAADAASHPNANIITRAVGAGALNLDCVTGDVRPGDAFLLASDGLTRLVGEDELLDALRAADLAAVADRLIETCLERGAPDNVSFVLLRAPAL